MSFYAVFTVDNGVSAGYEVVGLKIGFAQTRDDKGRPNSEVFGSYIVMRLSATDDNELTKWMLDAFDKRNGKIQFFRTDQASVFKEISFTNGYCMDFVENFNPSERQGSLTMDIYISPESTTIQGVTHRTEW